MDIISVLASQQKINSNLPNKQAASLCMENPELLKDIAGNLASKDKKLAGDCAEVFTETALLKPELIAEYGELLIPLLSHKETRVRWESMHSLALIAGLKPELILSIIPILNEIIIYDKSVIVRDYAVDAVSAMGGKGRDYAGQALKFLISVLEHTGDRHAGKVLNGLINIYLYLPAMKSDIMKIAGEFKESPKGVVKKAAVKLEKMLNK
jgi:hypothetical protein